MRFPPGKLNEAVDYFETAILEDEKCNFCEKRYAVFNTLRQHQYDEHSTYDQLDPTEIPLTKDQNEKIEIPLETNVQQFPILVCYDQSNVCEPPYTPILGSKLQRKRRLNLACVQRYQKRRLLQTD